jgi:threonylcarbamoyladenosine tRNA methylthiotransferase MtaB
VVRATLFSIMKRVAIHTLGCKLNYAESVTLGKEFLASGYRRVEIDDPADVVVINSCSVTERADRECRQLVRRALRHSPNAYVVVIGCYAQLQPGRIASIPGVDLVLGTKEKFDVFKHAERFEKREQTKVVVSPIESILSPASASSIGFTDRTRAFLKIQDGCDYTCAFCTIPLARGASRSIASFEIVRQAREVVEHGFKEIVLTGVNVGDYGRAIGSSLLRLLKELVAVDGVKRIRVSSVEPNLLTDELLDFWLSHDVMCKHFHIPLQSGADDLLKSMRRRYLSDWYASRVERIKSFAPDAGIGADVISGFPGETEELFQETYRFLVDLPVSYLHAFTYSERPNTAALGMPAKVEPRIRFQRTEMLRNLSLRKRLVFNQSFLGKNVEVLFESRESDGSYLGHAGEYVLVRSSSTANLINTIHRVKITNCNEEECAGELPIPSNETNILQEIAA